MHNALNTNEVRRLIAWRNARPTANPNIRIDRVSGREISWDEFGLFSERGWRIENVNALAAGGPEQARHWRECTYVGGLLRFIDRVSSRKRKYSLAR
jgi:hypothetical protein